MPTTRECVYLVTRAHFRSCDKDGGPAIRSAIAKNLMLHANFVGLFYRTGVTAEWRLREYGFSTVLLLWPWPWPWPEDFHIQTWPPFQYRDIPDTQKCELTMSEAFESYRQRDRQTETTVPRNR